MTRFHQLARFAVIAFSTAAAADTFPTDQSGAPAADRLRDVRIEPSVVEARWSAPVTTRGVGQFLALDAAPDADLPVEVVFTPDGTTALIAHWASDNVSFFDVATRTVTGAVGVGDFPSSIAVSPDGVYAVTPNVFSNSISIIDVATRTRIGDVPVTGLQPYKVAITSDSRFAVVGVINDAVNSSFSVVDLVAQSEVHTFPSSPQGVIGGYGDTESGITGPIFTKFALAPDDSAIVLIDRGNSSVKLYAPATGALLQSVATAANPAGIDISRDSTTAVVSHEFGVRRISEIDLPTRTVTGDFNVGVDLSDQLVRITPDKSHAIAAISNNVIFVNLTSGAVTATLATGVVGDIEISHDGQFAFVSNFNARIINIATQTIAATIPFAACVESAVSPTSLTAVALNSRFREDIHVYNINGASSSFLGFAESGPAPEADACRVVAVSPNGRTLVVNNNVSRNVAVVDLPSRVIRGYISTGDRPQGAAITPDSSTAVVANTDASTVSIIDLATMSTLTTLNVATRPVHVRISPDGQRAYVLTVAGTDMIHFIQLNGAASSVVGTALALQTGSAFGYAFTEVSGIELNPAGTILAVCASFDDKLRLIDTATRAVITDVTVGDFPIRVQFSPDGTRAYVANAFSNNLSVVNIAGAGSSVIATVPLSVRPLTIDPDPAGQFVYLGVTGTGSGGGGVRVLNTASNSIVATLNFGGDDGPRDSYLDAARGKLIAASTGAEWVTISPAGAASAIIERQPMTSTPSDMAYSQAMGLAVAALPVPDGVDLLGRPPCAGDVDLDGDVDLTDLALLLTQFGTVAGGLVADLNADGAVNLTDLALLLSNFGSTCP